MNAHSNCCLSLNWFTYVRETSSSARCVMLHDVLVVSVIALGLSDAFLSHSQQQMQETTKIVAEHSARLGPHIHRGKSKILTVNSTNTISAILGEEETEDPGLARQGWPSFN